MDDIYNGYSLLFAEGHRLLFTAINKIHVGGKAFIKYKTYHNVEIHIVRCLFCVFKATVMNNWRATTVIYLRSVAENDIERELKVAVPKSSQNLSLNSSSFTFLHHTMTLIKRTLWG